MGQVQGGQRGPTRSGPSQVALWVWVALTTFGVSAGVAALFLPVQDPLRPGALFRTEVFSNPGLAEYGRKFTQAPRALEGLDPRSRPSGGGGGGGCTPPPSILKKRLGRGGALRCLDSGHCAGFLTEALHRAAHRSV